MGFAIMRIDKIKSVVAGNARLKHNRRQTRCVTSNPSKKNICLTFSEQMRKERHRSFRQIFHDRIRGQNIRSNAVIALEIVLTFSHGAISDADLKSWARSNADWLRKVFGEDNIIDCQLHMDEKTPHIHCIVIPLDERGKLNARAYIGGTRERMSRLQTDYAKAMEPHGLERGVCRELTKARHESSLRWHQRHAEKEVRLRAYERKFGTEESWDFDEVLEFKDIKNQLSKEKDSSSQISIEITNNK